MTRNTSCLLSLGFAVLGLAASAHGAVPPMQVTVSETSGQVAFRGTTGPNAMFSTANLRPGHYIVQFTTTDTAARGSRYLVVVSAGVKKVVATGIGGEAFMHGGAAMKVNVEHAAKITGQLADEQTLARESGSKYRIIGGQRFVWVQGQLGTNRGGHWAEEGEAPALNVGRVSLDSIRKLQDRAGEGTMVMSRAERPGG